MPTLTLDGIGKINVDDSFLKLSPEEQNKTVDEIAASLKKPTSMYDTAKIPGSEWIDEAAKKPKQPESTIGSRFMEGVNEGLELNNPLGVDPEELNKVPSALRTPAQQIAIPADIVKRGLSAATLGGIKAISGGDERLERDLMAWLTSAGVVTGMVPNPMDFTPKGMPKITPDAPPPKAPIATPGQQVVEAGARQNIPIPNAIASDNPFVQSMGRKASDLPFVGQPLENAAKDTIGKIDTRVKEIQSGYGGASTPAAGEAARGSIESYISGKTKAKKDALYERVDELVDPDIASPLTNTFKKLQEINAERAESHRPPLKLQDINPELMTTSPDISPLYPIETRGRLPNVSYNGIKNLRTSIGEKLKDPKSPLPADMAQSELKRLYSGLSDDLGASIEAAGEGPALNAWKRANKYNRLLRERYDNLNRLLKSNSEEGIVQRLATAASSKNGADITLLRQARKAMGKDVTEDVSSALISHLGRDGENFSPTKFMTAWNKITPEAKSILFRSTGKSDLANGLNDIATISQRFDDLQKYANPSRSGAYLTTSAATIGLLHNPILTLSTIFGGRELAKHLAKPAVVPKIATYAKAATNLKANSTPMTVLQFKQASQALAAAIAKENGTPQAANALAIKLQSTAPAAAQDDQNEGVR